MQRDSIEQVLRAAVAQMQGHRTPPRLAAALEHAVFPGGRRIRPRLVRQVAQACGNAAPSASDAAAAAIELLHCASLVHDDLPCFDDAAFRRGQPSVVARFGEPLAVLVGDGLIVGAFEVLARGCTDYPQLLPALVAEISAGVGTVRGIVAGQAWETEASIDLRDYHRLKTGALFEAGIAAGAIAGGGRAEDWQVFSQRLGAAYQLADDIADQVASPSALGKPVGQDAAHGRPNAVSSLGRTAAAERLARLLATLPLAVPDCPHRAPFVAGVRALVTELTDLFAPRPDAVATQRAPEASRGLATAAAG